MAYITHHVAAVSSGLLADLGRVTLGLLSPCSPRPCQWWGPPPSSSTRTRPVAMTARRPTNSPEPDFWPQPATSTRYLLRATPVEAREAVAGAWPGSG